KGRTSWGITQQGRQHMKTRIKAGLALAATITLVGSAGVAAANPLTGCVSVGGGGYACYGTLPPNHPVTPEPDTPPAPEGQVLVLTTERLGGADRYETAVLISQAGFPDSAPVVYIANGSTGMADALAAGPLATDG